MDKYNTLIAENEKVEMIHVSLDSDESAAQKWASKEAFPWLTVLPEKVKASGLRKKFKTTRSVPEYHLIDKNGATVVAGTSNSSPIFLKIKELQ